MEIELCMDVFHQLTAFLRRRRGHVDTNSFFQETVFLYTLAIMEVLGLSFTSNYMYKISSAYEQVFKLRAAARPESPLQRKLQRVSTNAPPAALTLFL